MVVGVVVCYIWRPWMTAVGVREDFSPKNRAAAEVEGLLSSSEVTEVLALAVKMKVKPNWWMRLILEVRVSELKDGMDSTANRSWGVSPIGIVTEGRDWVHCMLSLVFVVEGQAKKSRMR